MNECIEGEESEREQKVEIPAARNQATEVGLKRMKQRSPASLRPASLRPCVIISRSTTQAQPRNSC